MKQKLIAICIMFLSGLVFGQKVENLDEKKQSNFSQTKELLKRSISEREQILAQEKSCINKAINKTELKECLQKANQNRKDMSEKLKSSVKTKP